MTPILAFTWLRFRCSRAPDLRVHVDAISALGLAPSPQDVATVLGQMQSLALIRAGEAMLRGLPDDERKAEAYTAVLTKIIMLKDAVAVPSAEIEKRLRALALRTDLTPKYGPPVPG